MTVYLHAQVKHPDDSATSPPDLLVVDARNRQGYGEVHHFIPYVEVTLCASLAQPWCASSGMHAHGFSRGGVKGRRMHCADSCAGEQRAGTPRPAASRAIPQPAAAGQAEGALRFLEPLLHVCHVSQGIAIWKSGMFLRSML